MLYLLPGILIPIIIGFVVVIIVNNEVAVPRLKRISNPENSTIIKTTLRDKTGKGLPPETVQIMLRNKGIFDSRRNSVGTGITHEFEAQNGGTVVYDRMTDLM